VIIIDDGSPDGTQEAAKQLQNIYGKEYIVCVHFLHICAFPFLFSLKTSCDLLPMLVLSVKSVILFSIRIQTLFLASNFLISSAVVVHCV